MQAILLALGPRDRETLVWTNTPPALRPVLDRPLVHHVMERLVGCGTTDVLVVTEAAEGWAADALGDGRRWGCVITYTAVSGEPAAIGAVRQAALASEQPLIALASADRLPLCEGHGPSAQEMIAVDVDDAQMPGWAGWAVLPPACLAEVARATSLESFGKELVAAGNACTWIRPEGWLDARRAEALLGSNRHALDVRQRGLLATGREIDPGIWTGRNVRLGPGVRLIAPVFIGENTSIGARCTIGPDVTIGSSCLIDTDSSIERSMVTAGSYVGEGLTVVESIVDGSTLVNVRLGTSVHIDDPLLLAGTRPPRPPR